MHILLTGASGRIGRRTLDLLSKSGHSITALDLHRPKIPLPQTAAPTQFHQIDLTDFKALEKVFEKASESSNPVDAIVHLGAIPDPTKLDDRVVHNNNVTSNYNVLKTSMNFGVKRIVQASSVNATGLSYTIPEHLKFDMLPLNEESPKRPVSLEATLKLNLELGRRLQYLERVSFPSRLLIGLSAPLTASLSRPPPTESTKCRLME